MSAGLRLKELRSRLGITTREVADHSQQIAAAEGNPEFYISNAWLTKLENTDSVPSIHKLVSLSVVYQVRFSDLVELFGIDLEQTAKRQFEISHRQTHPLNLEAGNPDKPIMFPVRLEDQLDLDMTNMLSRMVERWSEVPIAAIQHLDLRHNHYGFIGFQDFTLYPLLRPGSFVQIDPHVRKVHTFHWRTEFDRPIYFLELRDRYACGWCEIHDRELMVVPHPLSPCSIQRFPFPGGVEIVGQVTGVATRIVSRNTEAQKLSKRS
jgi:transcriptional regulator with XRE-family HTH domain